MDLQTLAHSNSLQARNVDYLVSTINFILAFNQGDEAQQLQLERGVRDLDVPLINTIIRGVIHDCLESKNILELRDIGKQHNIYGVTKINKSQLIYLIEQERNKKNEEDSQD
jgi:hypothetical protein